MACVFCHVWGKSLLICLVVLTPGESLLICPKDILVIWLIQPFEALRAYLESKLVHHLHICLHLHMLDVGGWSCMPQQRLSDMFGMGPHSLLFGLFCRCGSKLSVFFGKILFIWFCKIKYSLWETEILHIIGVLCIFSNYFAFNIAYPAYQLNYQMYLM